VTTVPAVAFSHLGLYVRELAAMEDFYGRVMGFTVTDRGELDSPAGRYRWYSSAAIRGSTTNCCSLLAGPTRPTTT